MRPQWAEVGFVKRATSVVLGKRFNILGVLFENGNRGLGKGETNVCL